MLIFSLLLMEKFPWAMMRDADVAQLAEQLICNQQVNGSSPFIGFAMIISNDP